MSLNIKNERVHEMVRQLAELTGQSQTSAVEDAVRRRLEEMGGAKEAEVARRLAAIRGAVVEFNKDLPPRPTYEEIIEDMYDDMGLPR
ncbi:type II toxin-antitoxin system VapB family antitoxin [Microbacterium sp. A93]|uniref:type II toxin-antitoxin system VapB family antitoxin n=1 Tax=unclassified Microbacterium TaxID=2609290 RepID=UPI003F436D05